MWSRSKSLALLRNLSRYSHLTQVKIPKASNSIFDVETLDDFETKVIRSQIPVVVDFHARWCNPCKALTPRLEAIVKEQQGRIQLARVDIDDLTDLALNYKVTTVPSLMVVCNGKILNQIEGLRSCDYLRDWLKSVVQPKDKLK